MHDIVPPLNYPKTNELMILVALFHHNYSIHAQTERVNTHGVQKKAHTNTHMQKRYHNNVNNFAKKRNKKSSYIALCNVFLKFWKPLGLAIKTFFAKFITVGTPIF